MKKKRGEEKKRRKKKKKKTKKKRKGMETMVLYANYLCMDHYGFCMDTSLSHFLGFS